MPLTIGTRLGPYEITGPLGAGGMGEVYRARDTRLGRDVAIKVLPSNLSHSPDVRARFEREARAISSLNHPHICTLHDVGKDSGVDYLVMELLEGESLADRLARGSLPLAELTRLGAQIADALDKAHRKGLVHRDLKPANIMLTKAGAKLLDFGLARAAGPGAASELTGSPTMAKPLTAEGSIVGTFQYMSPEQLEGKETDARTDLWALGCVLYEMATGKRAFAGASQASLISSIMKDEPRPIGELAPMSPPWLDRVVRQCLAKDPEERWQSAGDLKRELIWIAESGSQAATLQTSPAASRRRLYQWVAGAAGVLLAGAMLVLGYLLHAPAPSRVLRANLGLPRGTTLDPQDSSLALSPDGTRLAFAASGADGKQRIWVRPMDSLVAQPLAGTEGATYPFWSPDGQYLGFFADRKLKKIQAGGGTVQTICEAADGRGASWSQEEGIVFAPDPFGPLLKVSASGGSPVAVTTAEKEGLTHRLPHFLPDGHRLLFVSATTPGDKDNGIYVLDLESKTTSLVGSADSEGLYLDPGYLIFVRDTNLMAQPVNARTLRPSGEAVPIAEKVRFSPYRYTGAYTLSSDGLLLYVSGAVVPNSQLTWFDLDGKKIALVGAPATFFEGPSLAIAPDGRTAAAAVRNDEGKLGLWSYDLERGVGSRLTFGSSLAAFPLWSPDGRQLIYVDGFGSISIKAAGGSSEAQTLISGVSGAMLPSAWSPDGSVVTFWTQSGKTGSDIWILPMTGDRKPYPFIETQPDEQSGGFSPDGKWLSYLSDESGRQELFVVPFPGPGGRWQISSDGAVASWWLGDGHEIMYVTSENKLVAVEVTAKGSNLEIGAARPLFGGRALPAGSGAFTRDGKRYLVAVPVEERAAPELILVTNWAAQIETK